MNDSDAGDRRQPSYRIAKSNKTRRRACRLPRKPPELGTSTPELHQPTSTRHTRYIYRHGSIQRDSSQHPPSSPADSTLWRLGPRRWTYLLVGGFGGVLRAGDDFRKVTVADRVPPAPVQLSLRRNRACQVKLDRVRQLRLGKGQIVRITEFPVRTFLQNKITDWRYIQLIISRIKVIIKLIKLASITQLISNYVIRRQTR